MTPASRKAHAANNTADRKTWGQAVTVGADGHDAEPYSVHLVEAAAELPDGCFGIEQDAHSTRHRLAMMSRDPRFRTTFLVACSGTTREPVGILPVSRPVLPQWHETGYDPARLPSQVATVDPSDYLLVAGTGDFHEVVAVSHAHAGEHREALRALWREALAIGRAEDRFAIAQYVRRDGSLAAAARKAGGLFEVPVTNRYVIPNVAPNKDGYLEGLDRRRRSLVRRDLRDIAAAGFRTTTMSWDALPEWAFEAISAVKSRYTPTNPRLVSFWLRQLAQDPAVERVAFVSEAASGARSVSLGWFRPGVLELYEVGLLGPERDRVQAYLEVMFYAPLRHLWARGGGSLDLALEASRPKVLRGAHAVPLVALLDEGASS